MKKKLVSLLCAAAVVVGMSSCCTITPIAATSNPVGNRCGVAESTRFLGFGGNANVGINAAAKNGGITKISHVDWKIKRGLFTTRYTILVYGE